ncbi:MAG TPA: class I SAM-dependent methyltransferase [Planctomycetes bacterium]|nr:class I SAM-dependent methyltransferase [Planctomycetota bacterium]
MINFALFHLLKGKAPDFSQIQRIVIFGSGTEEQCHKVVSSLRRIFPEQEILLIGPSEMRVPEGVEFLDQAELGKNRRQLLREIRAGRPDLGAWIINGSFQYWRQWILGGTLNASHYMVFNENGDGFFLIPRHAKHFFRVLFGSRKGGLRWTPFRWLSSLFLQTMGYFSLLWESWSWQRQRRRNQLRPAFALWTPGLGCLADPGENFGPSAMAPGGGAQAPQEEEHGDFSGERFIPGVDPDLEAEHLARYQFVFPLAEGARVLDAGSGEGYGAALLARVASEVVAIDVDPRAIEKAKQKYPLSNLHFQLVEADADYPFPEKSFDLVSSFEVIEHIHGWEKYLEGIAKVLKDDGVLVISSPNRPYYREERGEINPFHVHEFDLEEFREVLGRHFPYLHFFGENHGRGVFIDDFSSDELRVVSETRDHGLETSHFLIAMCSRSPLPQMEGIVHVNSRGNQLRDREQEIKILRKELLLARESYERLEREFEERSAWALWLNRRLEG